MRFEIVYTYNYYGGVARKDEELSVPTRDITPEKAKMFMYLLEETGYTRHETNTQIFYSKKIDNNHYCEQIFYK